MSDLRQYIGWFDRADQIEPTYNPPVDGPCIVCTKPLTEDDVRTVSVMWSGGDRCLFYRMHRTCGDALSDAEKAVYETAILDAAGLLPGVV